MSTIGYVQDVLPESGVGAAWGARAILTGGTYQTLPDRQTYTGFEDDKRLLFNLLNTSVGDAMRRRIKELVEAGEMRPDRSDPWMVFEEGRVHIYANTNASHGYLYLTAWVDSVTEYEYSIHFGLYPNSGRAKVMGHDDPEDEEVLHFPELTHATAYVSGSWACWGPYDQPSDGDDSLHVMVSTDTVSASSIASLYRMILDSPDTDGHLLEHGVVTTWKDHSEVTHIWLWDPGMKRLELLPYDRATAEWSR